MMKPQGTPAAARPVMQCRAGRMILSNGVVNALTDKGTLSLTPSPTGGFELAWKPERKSSSVEPISRLFFKDSVAVSKVTKCTTGRVWVFDAPGAEPLFFWLQELPDDAKETKYMAALHKALGKPKAAGASPPPPAATTAASPPPATTGASGISLSDLISATNAAVSGGAPERIDLQSMLSSGAMLEALRADPAFYMARLHEFLPDGTDPAGDVVEAVRNPQVSSTAAMLQAALAEPSGLQELCAAFQIPVPSGRVGALEFLEALMAQQEKGGAQ